MTWLLSPSGWPSHAENGSLLEQRLLSSGWLAIDQSQVAAAVDAYIGGEAPAPPEPPFFDTEVAALVPGPSATATALRAALLNGVEGVKVHDGTAGGGARPTGYVRVRWVGGTTRPTNMVTGDLWEHDA